MPLIVAAERPSTRRIFTLDSDFYIYRLTDSSTLICVGCDAREPLVAVPPPHRDFLRLALP